MSALSNLPPGIDLRKAPRVWLPNGSGVGVRVICPEWLAAARREADENDLAQRIEQDRLASEKRAWTNYVAQYRRAVRAQTVPCAPPIRSAFEDADLIIERIAAEHGVTRQQILERKRTAKLTAARFAAIHAVASAYPKLSTPTLGRIFNRDHASIVYALKPAEWRKDRGT